MNSYYIALFDKLFNDVVSRSFIIDDVDNILTVNGLLGCRTGETKKSLKETKTDLDNCSLVLICFFQRKYVESVIWSACRGISYLFMLYIKEVTADSIRAVGYTPKERTQ